MLGWPREPHAPVVEGEGEETLAGEPLGERRIESLGHAHRRDDQDGAAARARGPEDPRHDVLPSRELDLAALEHLALHAPQITAAAVPSQPGER